jgi:hypothetical protein
MRNHTSLKDSIHYKKNKYFLVENKILLTKALFVNFVAICAKKVSETKSSIGKLLNGLRKDATKTD